ncbi:MAG: hypothetical protein PHU85_19075, partial [Phycisphaerae bacterium]|nr:hypothetical protein [Phycisphaerae bacterium]
MFSARRRFWLLGGILVLINIAGLVWIRQSLVGRAFTTRFRVMSLLPQANLDAADRLALLFDTPVVQAGAIGRALDRPPFMVSPSPAGHWQWSAVDRLEFVLDKPLPAGRRFKVLPAKDFELTLGGALVGKSEFEVQTRALQVKACTVAHVDPDGVDILFEFNQPVAPRDLIEALTVKDDKAKLAPVPLGHDPADKIMVRTPRPAKTELAVRLDKELTGHGGQLALGSAFATTLQVAQKFRLTRADVSNPGLEETVGVMLGFSTQLDKEQATPQVTVTPPVKDLQVVRETYGLRLAGPFACGQRYKAEVPETIRSAGGESLGQAATIYFEVPDREPAVRFPFANGILSPQGNLSLDAELVNVVGVKLAMAKVHANNLVAHLNEADEAMTSRSLPEKTIKLDLPHNQPTKTALDLGALLGDPKEKEKSIRGVYRVFLQSTADRWTDASSMVAITDLGLTAKQQRDGYLVFVTSLRTAKPLEGVKVSAITRNNQVIATAVTDADGLTTLRTPAKHPDGPVWVLVAEATG